MRCSLAPPPPVLSDIFLDALCSSRSGRGNAPGTGGTGVETDPTIAPRVALETETVPGIVPESVREIVATGKTAASGAGEFSFLLACSFFYLFGCVFVATAAAAALRCCCCFTLLLLLYGAAAVLLLCVAASAASVRCYCAPQLLFAAAARCCCCCCCCCCRRCSSRLIFSPAVAATAAATVDFLFPGFYTPCVKTPPPPPRGGWVRSRETLANNANRRFVTFPPPMAPQDLGTSGG